jgi:hypothetical protein
MGKRAQRIPSWPGVIHSNKGRIHLRRPTCDILTFRLRRSGGPYIPIKALSRGCRVALPSLNPDWLKISSGGDLQPFSPPPQNHAIYALLVST